METVTVIGYVASLCSIASFTPQAWKIIKSRDVRSISAAMYAVTVTGFALWTAFGIMKGEWPIIITNSVCFLLAGFILVLKLLPERLRNEVAENCSILRHNDTVNANAEGCDPTACEKTLITV